MNIHAEVFLCVWMFVFISFEYISKCEIVRCNLIFKNFKVKVLALFEYIDLNFDIHSL